MPGNASGDPQPPIVSVVMPVYNVERYVEEAVRSILGQSLRDLELIVIDDGSTDATPAILDEVAHGDQRMRVVRQGRAGAIAGFNRGAAAARGHYLAWLGGDDVACPNRLAVQVAFLDAHPDVAAVGGSVIVIDATGQTVGSLRYPTASDAIEKMLVSANPIAAPAALIRKAAFEAVGRCRSPFVGAEDYDLWLRLSERYTLANISDTVVYYRVHDNQVSSRSFEQVALSTNAALLSARARRSGVPDPFDGGGLITRSRLLAAGLEETAIDERIAQLTAVRATVLTVSGRAQQALVLLDSVSASRSMDSLSREVRAMLAISRARALWALGDKRGSVRQGVLGLRTDSAYTARAAYRGLMDGIGRQQQGNVL
ncbi:MAG TPA: glycosyltransferase [Chloroflexota bacterium]|jgi:hypothetical protein|nr:glycosyltransferase [Chloroflexota bacterium]